MEYKVIGTPSRYIQGTGIIQNLNTYIEKLGNRFLFLADELVLNILKDKIDYSFRNVESTIVWVKFNGESSPLEVERIQKIFNEEQCNAVIGAGGGKALDTAKVIANNSNVHLVIIPTIASTDAPCSSLAVMYEEGKLPTDLLLPRNPDLVLVDVGVIANAPVRLLVAGMGDAFATYYEARACRASNAKNMFSGLGTNSAYELAKLSNKILLEDGLKAKIAAQNKTVTKALENIIETNIYLSGVGFENNGCAVAHGVYNGFSTLKRKHNFLHGECVAFGTLVQLALENVDSKEFNRVQNFFFDIGLPIMLEDLGMGDISQEELRLAAEATCKNQITHNMPFAVTEKMVYDAIIYVDALGRMFNDDKI